MPSNPNSNLHPSYLHGLQLWLLLQNIPSVIPSTRQPHLRGSFRRSFRLILRLRSTLIASPPIGYLFASSFSSAGLSVIPFDANTSIFPCLTIDEHITPASTHPHVNRSTAYTKPLRHLLPEKRPGQHIMPEPAISWNEVHGIHFSFGHHFGCGNKQWKLNTAFAQALPNIASLFIVDKDGSLIVAAIMDALPASEVFKEHKKDWYPYEFHKVYGPGYGVPLDKEMLQRKTPFHTQTTNNELKFNDKLIEQLKHKRNGETVQQVLPPKRKRPKTTTRPATGSLNPIKSIESEVTPTVQVPEQCTFESSNTTSPVIVPSGTTGLVRTKMIDSNNVETSLNSTALSDPHYTWTWNYFPNSESVSFRRIRSDSFLRATSSSPPVQRQEKSSIVTTPSVSPSALTRFGHHHVPPFVPANFVRTFNPQNEIATFRRLPKSVPSPSPSPQPPLCIPLLLPAEVLHEGTDPQNVAPAYIRSLQSLCRNQICSNPNHQPIS
eukprot:jgi/Psemu1/30634/gm1.30634_g